MYKLVISLLSKQISDSIVYNPAARLACRLGFESIDDVIQDFLNEPLLNSVNCNSKSLGLIRITVRETDLVVSYGHTTPGMNLGLAL